MSRWSAGSDIMGNLQQHVAKCRVLDIRLAGLAETRIGVDSEREYAVGDSHQTSISARLIHDETVTLGPVPAQTTYAFSQR